MCFPIPTSHLSWEDSQSYTSEAQPLHNTHTSQGVWSPVTQPQPDDVLTEPGPLGGALLSILLPQEPGALGVVLFSLTSLMHHQGQHIFT